VVIEQVAKLQKSMKLFKRKESIIKSIQEQNALSLDLEKKIHQILIYKSLKIFICLQKKKTTKADVAREHGLEPLAKIIMAQNNDDVDLIARIFE
jgi:uncharacterized protein